MSADPCTLLITADDVTNNCDIDQYDEANPPSDQDLEDVVAAASRVAWALGGRQHGVCSVENERPGRLHLRNRCYGPYRTAEGWVNGCACRPVSTVTLGRMPVIAIDEVRIGGSVVAPSDYALIGPNRLVRRVSGRWPACQLLQLDDDDPDVLVVDYTFGVPLDALGVQATAKLACELLKARTGAPCRLPERVTSVTRQGVSFVVIDPMSFLEKGRTGVYLFDVWLRTVNPSGLQGRPIVRSPDIAIPRGGTLVPEST